MANTPRQIKARAKANEPKVQRAFRGDVSEIVNTASVTAITGQAPSTVMQRLGIVGAQPWVSTLDSVRATYIDGGNFESESIRRGSTLRVRFDVRNTRAENWLRDHSAQFVTRINLEQQEAIRTIINAGIRDGRAPRTIALDIIGRVGANGRRTGGIIGLTNQQANYVETARLQLMNNDPAYFTRTRRDARYDRYVREAIADGKPLKQTQIDTIVYRYSDRLLQTRGQNIAQTEVLQAFNSGRNETYEQVIDRGVNPQNIRKKWKTAADSDVRHSHSTMQNQDVFFRQPFITGNGAQMMYPGDSSRGAGAEDIVRCRCINEVKVDFIAERLGRGR